MLKKIIGLCLAVMMLYTNCYAFSDINNSEMAQVIDELSDFGIVNGYDDNTFRPNNEITRAEFAKIIVAMTNSYMDVSSSNSFQDTIDHWAKDYIDISKELGIINGVTDTTFAPDANVTYEQAIKMIVVALGYNDEAVQKGGYPDGYLQQASELGITDKITFNPESNAVRGNISMIIHNALKVNYYSIWNENGTIKKMNTNKTLYQIHKELLEYNSSKDITDNSNEAVG